MHFWSLCFSKMKEIRGSDQNEGRHIPMNSVNEEYLFVSNSRTNLVVLYVLNMLATCLIWKYTEDATGVKLSNTEYAAYETHFRTLLHKLSKK